MYFRKDKPAVRMNFPAAGNSGITSKGKKDCSCHAGLFPRLNPQVFHTERSQI